MSLPRTTVECGVVRDPEYREVGANKTPVANVRVASKDRVKDGTGGYKDGEPFYFDLTVWGKPAQHLMESVSVGDLLLVVGRLSERAWDAEDGTRRTTMVLTADDVAVSLRWNIAMTPRKRDKGTGFAAVTPASDPTMDWGAMTPSDDPPF